MRAIRTDDIHAQSHRLDKHEPEAFITRGEHEELAGGEDAFGIADEPREVDPIRNPEVAASRVR